MHVRIPVPDHVDLVLIGERCRHFWKPPLTMGELVPLELMVTHHFVSPLARSNASSLFIP
jgi:hypothetical protein